MATALDYGSVCGRHRRSRRFRKVGQRSYPPARIHSRGFSSSGYFDWAVNPGPRQGTEDLALSFEQAGKGRPGWLESYVQTVPPSLTPSWYCEKVRSTWTLHPSRAKESARQPSFHSHPFAHPRSPSPGPGPGPGSEPQYPPAAPLSHLTSACLSSAVVLFFSHRHRHSISAKPTGCMAFLLSPPDFPPF